MRIVIPLLILCSAVATHAQPSQMRQPKPPPPANDMFTNAQVQTGYGWYAGAQTRSATHEKGDGGKATVWYSWTAPASGPTLVSIWDQIKPLGTFNVFSGTNLASLKPVKPLINKGRRLNLLFDADMGTTYHLEMNKPAGFQWDNSVDFTMQLTLTTVAIIEPTNNTLYPSSTNIIPLSMVTTEDPSMVASVKFLASGMPIAEVDTPPYTTAWSNAIPGRWEIYAELTRTDGIVLDTTKRVITIRPYNDNFADRKVLVGTNINISEPGDQATLEPGEPAVNGGGSVWYSWTAPGDGYVIVPHVFGSFLETINVFTGSTLSTLSLIPTMDSALNDIPVRVSAGETLQIAIFSGNLSLSFYAVPANDSFGSAIELSGTNTGFAGNNMAASAEPGEPVPYYAGGHSVWYTWTAPTNGALILEDTNSGIIYTDGTRNSPLIVTAFTGDDVTNLTAVSTNGLGNPAYIPVLGGTTYHIAIDNNSTNFGTTYFGVALSFAPAQPNDGFADRTQLTGNDVYFNYSTVGASTEPGEPDQGPNSLWWTWTAPYDGTAMVSGMQYSSAQGHAYTGDSLTNLTLVGAKNTYFFWSAQAGTTYQIAITSGWPGKVFEAGLHLHYYTNGTPIEP
jgi:hypothetical protein